MPRSLVLGALAMLAAGVIACGPIGPFPGGRLNGDLGAPDQTDWSFASEVENAQLETRPSKPHSVNTWFVALGPRLYVPTSMILGPKDPAQRGWVANVDADAHVRIRLGDRVFDRVAVRVDDEDEYARAREALEGKYGIEPEDRDPDRIIWIYRLDPR